MTGDAVLQWNSTGEGKISVDVVSSSGAVRKSLLLTKVKGQQNLPLSLNDLPSGVYVLRIRSGTQTRSLKFIKQ